jgi:hypothetical protein
LVSTVSEPSSPASTSVEALDGPPRGALVLAGADIAFAVWLLVCVGLGVAHAAEDDSVRSTAAVDAVFWAGWLGQLRGPIEFTLGAFAPAAISLVIASIASIAGQRVRSAPWIFRVLLAATVVAVVATAVFWTLLLQGRVCWGNLD